MVHQLLSMMHDRLVISLCSVSLEEESTKSDIEFNQYALGFTM